jgi:Protein of unknown function (DUF2934)
MRDFGAPRYNKNLGRIFFRVMARKSNPEKEMAVSGAAPAKAGHATPAVRSRRPAPAVETPVTRAVSETETASAVSVFSDADERVRAQPSPEQIAHLAYLYWLDRGGQQGSAEEDWLRAEQELRQSTAVS